MCEFREYRLFTIASPLQGFGLAGTAQQPLTAKGMPANQKMPPIPVHSIDFGQFRFGQGAARLFARETREHNALKPRQ